MNSLCSSWRWMILLSKASLSFFALGLFKAMGVFIPYLVDDLGASVAAIGTATGIYGSLCSVLAPLASALTPYGPRRLVIIGGAVMAIGTMGAAASTNSLHLTLWLALSSTGGSFVNVSAFKPLMDYFPESFATVNGISFAAGTVGMMALPPIAEWLIGLYGWRAALFLLGTATFNVCVFGALLRPCSAKSCSSTRYQKLHHEDEVSAAEKVRDDDGAVGAISRKCEACNGFLLERFDPKMFITEPRFSLFQLPSFVMGAVYSGWQLFLVPHSVALGYDSQTSSFLSTFGGLGSLVGRLTSGFLTDRDLIKPMDLFILACLLCGVSCLIDPLAVSSLPALAGLATAVGLAIGYTYPLTFVITRDLVGEDERQMAALGWLYLFAGAGQIFGGTISGWTYDVTSDYEIVFMMYGGLSLLVIPVMLAIRFTGVCCPT
ncbi:monocarboxylate transporter 13-like [Patiria miniata]|uniref:Major facilitator superfamily (MFS) profile domain-containing protein n=1 Tax=Patiria miniata TaxID=46514 RepID=A0A914B887_PATMI|nr:monocarboxylate transporter 13-like [Patiria miniata]XP_038072200.1 monocarboxylate transporter 13-like [Patiria miniata]XP_038072201.1 monocarboxylate transporter 13-like [Patiria miniata]XP_038072202.1 monocarboxylate transporter 13-like [Patiria miniata]